MTANNALLPLRQGGEATAFRADLHLHSTFSDGLKTPEALCKLAMKYHVQCVALSDHDTALGLAAMRAAARGCGLAFVPAVEVSTGEGGRVHVLCYGLDERNAAFTAFLARAGEDRASRAAEMLHRLKGVGVSLADVEKELLQAPGVGRAHIARAMAAAGYVRTVSEAFDRFLGEGKCAYVPRRHLSTGDAVSQLRAMGGVPVLAHPLRSGFTEQGLRAVLPEWIDRGLRGIEAFHPSAGSPAARRLESLARLNGLLVTGGSDYHGDPDSRLRVGRMPAGWYTCQQDVDALIHAFSSTCQRSQA